MTQRLTASQEFFQGDGSSIPISKNKLNFETSKLAHADMIFPNKEENAAQDFSWRDCAFSDSKYEKGMCEISMKAVAEIIFRTKRGLRLRIFPSGPPKNLARPRVFKCQIEHRNLICETCKLVLARMIFASEDRAAPQDFPLIS